jgi:signal transduction histidine kinase
MDRNCTREAVPSRETGNSRATLEKHTLALDALSNLTSQFCDKPDFEQLIDVLLMTLCGQFSVADSCAVLRKPITQSLGCSFFATGNLRSSTLLESLNLTAHDRDRFDGGSAVRRTSELASGGETDELVSILTQCGIEVVCSLIHGRKFLGIVGLGRRVTGKPYGQDDLDLLGAVTSTLTPLIANSYLFWEIASLNAGYLDILNSVKQGVFAFDEDHRLKKINAAALEILKTFLQRTSDRGSFVGSPVESVFPEWVFGELADQVIRSIGEDEGATATRVVARAKGTERIYNVGITRTDESGGFKAALIVTLDDVTIREENEQRLFDLQKLADKGLMASSISHELNNFLTLILGGVELMQMALAARQCEKAESMLDKIRTNIVSMERFTAGLTNYARLESERQHADLNSVINDVLSFLSVQSRFKHVTITSDLSAVLPQIRMDTNQIAQLLMNLLNNAADAIKEAHREGGTISISTAREDMELALVIGDNGAGIPPEVREKLFKTHFTSKQRGHGYGLVTCAKIVEKHSGTISVDSEVGKGTTFTIRFPIPPPEEAGLGK